VLLILDDMQAQEMVNPAEDNDICEDPDVVEETQAEDFVSGIVGCPVGVGPVVSEFEDTATIVVVYFFHLTCEEAYRSFFVTFCLLVSFLYAASDVLPLWS
jgi:hypothetical protein